MASDYIRGVVFDVHGLRIGLDGDWPEVAEQVRLDFAWFASDLPGGVDVTITLHKATPDLASYGSLEAAFVTPRNVVFSDEERTIIDYSGRAVAVLDRRAAVLAVTGVDPQVVHEAAYLFMLSRVGEHLDAIGLPRLHALGLAGAQGGVAVMLPSGGGKSTLALRALRTAGVRLLSEDSPLIDRHGMLHPFPLRMGLTEQHAAELPDEHVRRIERIEFDPKLLLDVEAFRDRIEPTAQPTRHLVIGMRTLGSDASLERIPRRRVAGTLLRECVVGVGIYQGMEFVLQRGMRDVLGKTRPAAGRAAACLAVARRADAWTLRLGRDREANWAALEPLLR